MPFSMYHILSQWITEIDTPHVFVVKLYHGREETLMYVLSFHFLHMFSLPLASHWVLRNAMTFLSFHMDATMLPFLQKDSFTMIRHFHFEHAGFLGGWKVSSVGLCCSVKIEFVRQQTSASGTEKKKIFAKDVIIFLFQIAHKVANNLVFETVFGLSPSFLHM